MLSLISLFTDMASEMLYPILPIYLKHIGFSIVLIGILEGIAEATAGLSKGYFGKWSDNLGRRVPFVQLGYGLSALSKPMMAVWTFPLWIFLSRTLDRVGKGIRTGARDALLSDESSPETKGRIFGFHRAMDTLGAVLGPSIALIYLYFYPENYRTLFFIAFVPGLMAIVATLFLKDKALISSEKKKAYPSFSAFFDYWKSSTDNYKKIAGALLVFALFNSSDMFLLLKAKETGLSDVQVVGMYIFYNLIYSLAAFPIGILADKIGFKKVFIAGLALFAIVYAGMALNGNLYIHIALFFLYGLYAAATDGVAKAWISNIADKKDTATAIGTFAGFQSIATMLASTSAGYIWYQFGATSVFVMSAVVAVAVMAYLMNEI